MSARAIGRSLVRPPVHPLRRLSLLAAGLVALALGGAVAPADAPAAATFRAVADAHVSSSSPASNLGRAKWLATDARPTKVAYLRFDPTDLSGTVTRATLRVYARSRHPTGFQVRRVASTRWRERRIRYTNAPSVSSTVLSRSGAFARGRWVYVDVTPAIRGNGGVSLAL